MPQEITIATETETPIRPLLESAIRSELDKIQLALFRTNKRLRGFEEKHGMASQDFRRKFEKAELNESIDYIEWFGEIKTLGLLNDQKKTLTGLNFVD